MKQYYPRIIDELLKKKLRTSGAVLLKGPKWCGKSTSASRIAKSIIFMQDPSTREQHIALAKASPKIFLDKETPLLIDEWQTIPFIWDAIRFEIDHRNAFNQFILTGSSSPIETSKITHSGLGRITTLVMRPMSLYESRDSSGEYSIKDLFNGLYPSGAISKHDILDYAYLACRGGFPNVLDLEKEDSLEISKNYFDSLVNQDFILNIKQDRDVQKFRLTLRSYARNIGTSCPLTTILKDVNSNNNLSISDSTIYSYLKYLNDIYILDELNAWSPLLRSKVAIRTSPTHYFVDPSIATAALDVTPFDLINDLKTFGFIFESMVIRDLKIYAETNGASLYHYRDKNDFEVDAIIHFNNGKWAAIEIKLFDDEAIGKACKNLIKFKDNIISQKMKEPSFLMVITGTKNAYRREDGVFIVPIDCLKN